MASTDNRAEDQARAQLESICLMVNALEVDYDRLEELRNLKEDADQCGNVQEGGTAEDDPVITGDELDELEQLSRDAGDCECRDDAHEAILQDPLDIQVRADWFTPGTVTVTPQEFMVLLCTGGPAVRIMGELDDYLTPSRAWIEYQDWGTSWTELVSMDGQDRESLLKYCSEFWFGE